MFAPGYTWFGADEEIPLTVRRGGRWQGLSTEYKKELRDQACKNLLDVMKEFEKTQSLPFVVVNLFELLKDAVERSGTERPGKMANTFLQLWAVLGHVYTAPPVLGAVEAVIGAHVRLTYE